MYVGSSGTFFIYFGVSNTDKIILPFSWKTHGEAQDQFTQPRIESLPRHVHELPYTALWQAQDPLWAEGGGCSGDSLRSGHTLTGSDASNTRWLLQISHVHYDWSCDYRNHHTDQRLPVKTDWNTIDAAGFSRIITRWSVLGEDCCFMSGTIACCSTFDASFNSI